MKYLTLLILFIGIVAEGVCQKKPNGILISGHDSIWGLSWDGVWDAVTMKPIQKDTVEAVFMVSDIYDTLVVASDDAGGNKTIKWVTIPGYPAIFWLKGYVAIDYSGFLKPIEHYLDEKKNRLPKNAIVWQWKEVKWKSK